MKHNKAISPRRRSIMVLGVGSFAHSIGGALAGAGAAVSTYLTRDYGHFPPSLVGPTFLRETFPSPVPLLCDHKIDCVIPQSIDWAQAPWAGELLKSKTPIFSATGEAMKIERERDFARKLCAEFKIPFPKSFVAANRIEAEKILARHPQPFVIKNPLCSPTSPIHTILCETVADTRAWLRNVNYAEGVFLQEYLGRAEAGHIVLVSGGEIHSLVTNQEYKYAFNGNLGIVAGAPLGGLVERDPHDQYGLARQLIHPLLPWLREVKFNGPLQVTAIKRDGQWHVMTLCGLKAVDPAQPVLHVSYYEAEAFARFAGKHLPSEQEWEIAARAGLLADGFGVAWQWTRSAYLPYPGYRAAEGALGEYNGKFMVSQMVLRGSSLATPEGHDRVSYRNFFYPPARWQFSSVRLAEFV